MLRAAGSMEQEGTPHLAGHLVGTGVTMVNTGLKDL